MPTQEPTLLVVRRVAQAEDELAAAKRRLVTAELDVRDAERRLRKAERLRDAKEV